MSQVGLDTRVVRTQGMGGLTSHRFSGSRNAIEKSGLWNCLPLHPVVQKWGTAVPRLRKKGAGFGTIPFVGRDAARVIQKMF